MADPENMTVAMVAARWGCSGRHVYNMIHAGELPAFRLGGKLIRIKRWAVEELECRNTVSSGSERNGTSASDQDRPADEFPFVPPTDMKLIGV
ncbi:MAG: helix-turn-helix domain-containing protein [Pseudomonadota bacterium]